MHFFKEECAVSEKKLLSVLQGNVCEGLPIWLMRQAGRYLPEYREIRKQYPSFLDFVASSADAAEVTVQPIRRYGMDGAILFSDILVVPDAMGQKVEFLAGEGPRLDPIRSTDDILRLQSEGVDAKFNDIYHTIEIVCETLSREGLDDTTLLGFAGAPWTIACYMVQGQGSRDYQDVKAFASADRKRFDKLIEMITDVTICYLDRQIESGVDAVKIFDSWAGVLDEDYFRAWCIEPTQRIVNTLKSKHPNVPIIGFPRGAGVKYVEYTETSGVDVVAIDSFTPMSWAVENLSNQVVLQGNLDPVRLLNGGECLETGIADILKAVEGRPCVFNLGHGIIKETPPEHVARLVQLVRGA